MTNTSTQQHQSNRKKCGASFQPQKIGGYTLAICPNCQKSAFTEEELSQIEAELAEIEAGLGMVWTQKKRQSKRIESIIKRVSLLRFFFNSLKGVRA